MTLAPLENLVTRLPAESYSSSDGCVYTHPIFDKIRHPAWYSKDGADGLSVREEP